MTINEYVLKLQGKVGMLEPLILDHSYQLSIGGQITQQGEESNQNGTSIKSFTFRPITVEILSDKGEIIKTIDPRKQSQKLRGRLFQLWQDSHDPIDFPEYYEKKMSYLIKNLDVLLQDVIIKM